MNTLKAVQI